MEDINQVTMVCRLTAAPELKGSVLPMRLAYTTRAKDGDQWLDKSNYIDAVVFGRVAEALEPMLDKGTRVAVAGYLQMDEWTTRDGDKRSATKIVCRSVQIVDGGKQRGGSQLTSAQGGGRATGDWPAADTAAPAASTHDDSIPF